MSLLACEDEETRALLASAVLGAAETLLVRTLPGLPEGVGGETPLASGPGAYLWHGAPPRGAGARGRYYRAGLGLF